MKKISLSIDSTVAAGKDQVSTALPDEVVILHLKKGFYFGVDHEVGVRIWQLLKEPIPVCQILDTLVREYEVDSARCERDLVAFLRDLAGEALIEVKNGKGS